MDKKQKVARFNISWREEDKKWQIKRVNAKRVLKLFSTQTEAVDYARIIATSQNATIILFKANGKQETIRKMKNHKE